jgi:putative SOS response-associated peptidase YedK
MTELSESESKTWPGPKPLFMAGIFSIWHASNDPGKKKPIYSYTIITR